MSNQSSRVPRRLIWIPVIHSQADLGSAHDSVRELYIKRIGHDGWNRHIRAVDGMWKSIRESIENLDLDYTRLRIYQDGLPNCGFEAEIVRELAQAGSQNHRIVLDLMAKGAQVIGTESPELLLEEYNLARQALLSPEGTTAQRQRELSNLMLEKRDRYIAQRIDQTLQKGETGMIFLGILHALEGRLPSDIRTTRLDYAIQPSSP